MCGVLALVTDARSAPDQHIADCIVAAAEAEDLLSTWYTNQQAGSAQLGVQPLHDLRGHRVGDVVELLVYGQVLGHIGTDRHDALA